MRKSLYKKNLVFGIIALLLCTIIIPSINGEVKNSQISTLNNYFSENGSTEYWGLFIGPWVYGEDPLFQNSSRFSAEKMCNSLLLSDNWQEDHIKMITCADATKSNIIKGLRWLDSVEDEDDVSLIYIATHGEQLSLFGIPLDFPPIDEADHCDEVLVTYWSFKYPFLTYLRDDELKFYVNQLESQGICIIIDSCYAGGFNDAPGNNLFRNNIIPLRNRERCFSSSDFIKDFSEEIKGDNRVIIMATEEDKVGWATPEGHDFTLELIEPFEKGIIDINSNGFISAEEAFDYVEFKPRNQHPTIYDGYNGELDLIVSSFLVDFFDKCESDSGWTTVDHTDGIGGDLWHRSEIDCNSPTHCWYFGDENTIRYNDNMNNSLVSTEIKLGVNPFLTIKGKSSREHNDHLLVDTSTNNWSSYQTEEIHLPYNSNWWWATEEIYLNEFSGKTVQIRFRVVSDESIPFNPYDLKGFFKIDDIIIFSEWTVNKS